MKGTYTYRTVLDDFQQQIENKIKNHKNEPNFPQMGNTLTEEILSDYLFEYQAALDSEGTERTQYTIAGFLMCLPLLFMSAFPEKSLPYTGYKEVIFGVSIGLVLFFIYRVAMKIMVKSKIKSVNKTYPEAQAYVEKVKAYTN